MYTLHRSLYVCMHSCMHLTYIKRDALAYACALFYFLNECMYAMFKLFLLLVGASQHLHPSFYGYYIAY
jgi:hypothetical protein